MPQERKPLGRPRKEPWPEPIPDDPETIMRIIMRTPSKEIRGADRKRDRPEEEAR